MQLEIVRRIRGNVHGTIDITALEDKVLDHPIVQRLRRIKQLAFLSFVFPGATHTRFEHSLGVMQLAGITWDKLWANQRRLAQTCNRHQDFAATEQRGSDGFVHGLLAPTFNVIDEVFSSPYTQQALRLAALLHDLGHPAFSHSGERFMPTWKMLLSGLKGVPPYLMEFIQKRCDSLAAKGKDPYKTPVRHEVYTLLLLDKMLNEVYQTYKSQGVTDPMVAPRDVASIITPEITPTGGSILHRHGIHKLCNELISGEVDIDRMDYLMRDSKECGVVYGIFDASRILDSLTVYHDPLDSCLHLSITLSGLAAFEDYLRARYSMYLQVYFHKTSVAAEAMIQNLAKQLGGFTLPVDVSEYAELDEYNIEAHLLKAAEALPADQRPIFAKTLRDLLRDRHLWKRVYEISVTESSDNEENAETIQARMQRAQHAIADLGVNYEQISSSGYLTTFRPRRENEMSRNYLRLIKKDEYQFPRVLPIEDHSTLIAANNTASISRIYVEDTLLPNGQSAVNLAKKTLTERLRPTPPA